MKKRYQGEAIAIPIAIINDDSIGHKALATYVHIIEESTTTQKGRRKLFDMENSEIIAALRELEAAGWIELSIKEMDGMTRVKYFLT